MNLSEYKCFLVETIRNGNEISIIIDDSKGGAQELKKMLNDQDKYEVYYIPFMII